MESGDRQRRILDNMVRDDCLDEEVTVEFFEMLSEKDVPKDARDAESSAFDVIKTAPDVFVCKGTFVPEGVFVRLFRVECVSDLRYRLPEDTLTSKGVNHKEFVDSLPDEDLLSLTDEYDGPIQLGNQIDVVWVTDFERVEPLLTDLAGLLDRLGRLAADSDMGRCVVVAYDREQAGRSVHVPRSLDAMGHPEFDVIEDCFAEMGMTKPITASPAMGLPEAVHRGCRVLPSRWEMRRIK